MNMRRTMIAWTAACCLLICAVPSFAEEEDKPGAGSMALDAVVARPVGIAITAVGAALFVVSLPFSALGGNVGASADALVLEPGRATFVRCLGCRTSGRYQSLND